MSAFKLCHPERRRAGDVVYPQGSPEPQSKDLRCLINNWQERPKIIAEKGKPAAQCLAHQFALKQPGVFLFLRGRRSPFLGLGLSRLAYRHRRIAWGKWFYESVIEREDVLEVVGRIGLVFSEHARIDQIENDLAEVIGRFDAPFVQHGLAHGAVFL